MLIAGQPPLHPSEQGELIGLLKETLKQGPDERQMVAEEIKEGFCYMLSMEWMRLIYTAAGPWKTFGTIDSPGSGHDCTEPRRTLEYYQQIANNFFVYSKLFSNEPNIFSGLVDINQTLDEFQSQMVQLCFADTYVQVHRTKVIHDSDQFYLNIHNRLQDNHARYFWISLHMHYPNGSAAGHRVAMFRCGKEFYFYDPNFGIYLLRENDLKSLADSLLTIYGEDAEAICFTVAEIE